MNVRGIGKMQQRLVFEGEVFDPDEWESYEQFEKSKLEEIEEKCWSCEEHLADPRSAIEGTCLYCSKKFGV